MIADIAAEIEQNVERKECTNDSTKTGILGMVNNNLVFFVCGVAIGVALMMCLPKVKASDTDSKVDQTTEKTGKVKVFPKGKIPFFAVHSI